MFDLRYHVASLAAVFFALVIGILVGVALASHGLGNSERKTLERQITASQNEIDSLNGQLNAASNDKKAGESFVANAYKAVMTDRLRGKKIAVLSIGPVDPGMRSVVTKTVADANGTILRIRAISVPLALDVIDRVLRTHRLLKQFAAKPQDIGRELADEFVVGGETALWNTLETQLVEERTGTSKQTADGVIVIRSAAPQTDVTSKFLSGLLGELASRSTAAAIEVSGARPSFVPLYRKLGLSSIDDADTAVGRVALAVVLAGDASSDVHYGTRTGDDKVMPVVPAVQTTPVTTGG